MNILVIKQTSLGDVLHSTGHVRSIKQKFPDSRLVLLTATSSEQIYRHNPWIDEIILIDRYGFKKNWWRKPVWAFGEMGRVWKQIRSQKFDIAFDLQGLAKSVVFLYGARAGKKYVKGNWWGLKGFSNKALHAITEMDGVLKLAGVPVSDTSMEFATSEQDKFKVDQLLKDVSPDNRPILIMSPYSRWPSKDWPLDKYVQISEALSTLCQVIFTGSPDREVEIQQQLDQVKNHGALNFAGKLSLLEFVELVSQANLMLTGDSFPMHVAGARKTPVIALFGPTDEQRVGPLGENAWVIRVDGCSKCDLINCARACLKRLDSNLVLEAVKNQLPR
jgi:ADP-heptose:LPS heptosyltransferase